MVNGVDRQGVLRRRKLGEPARAWANRGRRGCHLLCRADAPRFGVLAFQGQAEHLQTRFVADSQGIEHRDVKPANILLGTNSVLKFVDFGAAKVIAKGNKTLAKTRVMKTRPNDGGAMGPGELAGTPMYMAPEVIRSNEKMSGHLGAADIWSMGCVILEISTGRKPWSNLDNEW